jgi:nucleoside-diphosphate-sugar epimerase
MAFARFIASALGGVPAPLYGGDTDPVRDFTYVGDAVEGLVRSWQQGRPGQIYNIAGGAPAGLAEARAELSRLLGRRVLGTPADSPVPEPTHTRADLTRSRLELGYVPRVPLAVGLREQVAALGVPELLHGRGDPGDVDAGLPAHGRGELANPR